MLSPTASFISHFLRQCLVFPLKAFLLLPQPELAEEFGEEPACLKGKLMQAIHETNGFDSVEGRLRILGLAMLGEGNTVQNESWNATFCRMTKQRQQTHRLSVKELSTQTVGSCYKHRAAVEAPSVRRTPEDDQPDAPVEAAQARPPRGQGGAWHAFIRQRRLSNFAQAGLLYRELSEEENVAYKEEGHEATDRGRAGLAPFGPNRRELATYVQDRQLTAALERCDADQNLSAVDEYIEEAAGNGQDINQIAAGARRLVRIRTAEKKDAARQGREQLAQHSAEQASVVMESLEEVNSHIGELKEHFHVLPPVLGVPSLELSTENLASNVVSVASLVEQLGLCSATNFGKACDNFWSYMARRVESCDQRWPTNGEASTEDFLLSRCQLATFCVCKETMRPLLLLRSRVFSVFKEVFHRQYASRRRLLLDHRVFIRISWVSEDEDEDELMRDWGLQDPKWLHVSRFVGSPYELEFGVMEVATNEEREAAAAAENEVCLKVQGIVWSRIDRCSNA